MGQEEVQYHQNDYDKLDICLIDILSCYWKSSNGKLMLQITGLNGLSKDVVEADDVKIDYPNTIYIYLLGTSIGVKKDRESRYSRVAKEWQEWDVRFTNAKTRRIERLVRILGNDSLEEVFGSQVTMYTLRTLRYHRLFLARLNKPGGKDWRVPNNSGMKYGIRVLRNAKEDTQFDQEKGNKLWTNVILKELEDLISMKVCTFSVPF